MSTQTRDRIPGAIEHSFMLGALEKAQDSYELYSPGTGEVIAEIASCSPDDARRAADLAVSAFANWKARTAFERSAILRKWYELIMDNADELGTLTAMEMGKAYREARGEAVYAASFVKFYAEEAIRVYGETVPAMQGHKRLLVQKQPVGPVYAITPWNFPSGMVTRKAAPALAAGCSVILKPASQSPLTALRLAELWLEAGGEPGTLQVLPAESPRAISEVLINDPRIRKLTFTGSTEVGKILYGQAAETMKRISLELGGHAPLIVFEDADLDVAAREAAACKFRNAGQTCVCTNRLLVHESVLEEFTEKFLAATGQLQVGDPLSSETDIGPLVNQAAIDKVQEHVQDAVDSGARVAAGGKPASVEGGSSLFYEPTVLTGVTEDMLIMKEETFGPVAPIISFSSEEEAIRIANDTPYGLASYMFTQDLGRAFRVSEALEYGIVGINDGIPSAAHVPFGGVKDSGLGREGGKWGIEEYLDVKYISIGI